MSYSVSSTCWNCLKKEKCTDHVKIKDAVNEIHKQTASNEAGHMGSGNIMHQCFKCDPKDK
jgi:hypothetical protein